MTQSSNSNERRWLGDLFRGRAAYRGLKSIGTMILLGAAAVALTLFFRDVESDALRAQTQLTVVSEQLNAQDGLEWRAISGLVPPEEVREDVRAASAGIRDALRTAQESGLKATRAETLARLTAEYSRAVDRELTLLESDERTEALEFDEEVVDPAFAALEPELAAATAELADSGSRAGLINVGGLIGTVLLALLSVFALERRRYKQESSTRSERLSQERYRALIDRSSDFVFVLGPEQQLWYASPAAEEAGLAAPYLKLDELVHPDDRASAARLASARVGDTSEIVDLRLRHAELGWRICEVSVTALHGQQGDETVIVARDVTERAQAQQAVSKARDEAVEASEVKSMFLATMSHEIRTPMNGVIGMTSLLADTDLDLEQREYTQVIRASGESLLAIINDILDFSKIEAGQLDLETQPFELATCVEDALDVVAPLAAVKGLELLHESQEGCPPAVLGDVTRLRQILVNLLSNAVKFTRTGEIIVGMSCETADRTTVVHFTVADQGIGISDGQMEHLFQPFAQGDASTTRAHGGTGLGLAISRRLAAAMGGNLWAESEPGRGSVFHLTARLQVTEAAPMSEAPAPGNLRGRHVLVVDDSDNNRRILRHRLTSWGITSQDTGDPEAALEWVRAGAQFDLAVLDRNMPEMDGVKLATLLRATAGGRRLPLVLLSFLGDRPNSTDAAHFVAILSKPIRPSGLYDALADTLAAPNTADLDDRTLPAVLPGSEEIPRQRVHVLLAEDNLVNQTVAMMTLDRLGYQADIAANGLEVLQALRRQSYDIILMDVQMPELDGLDATRRIRQEFPANRQPRIIAMTANAFAEDRERCMEAGMDDYLSKPVRKEDLAAAMLRGRLNDQRSSEAPPIAPMAEPTVVVDVTR